MSAIAAIATPDAPGGISVIRISGEDALKIASLIFKSAGGKSPEEMEEIGRASCRERVYVLV